ncbi:unnamed protein product [Strongylus vulgaris]|uniref:SXP/RAL-2 family protein Ani s 5-like cation-binding domain-containing protein n=1 Tax=Strongylus vulgaris TaxID=40348 RepID=A0A3P7JB84_STRVU|nr:unnamed protein product [Strongylus vulgaris]
MRATILFMCFGFVLAQPFSIQVQPREEAEQGKNAGSGLLSKFITNMGNTMQKIQQDFSAAVQPKNPDVPTVVQEPVVEDGQPQVDQEPVVEDGQPQVQTPQSGFIQGMQNFMPEFISKIKEIPNSFSFLPQNGVNPLETFFGNVSKEGLEELKDMAKNASKYTINEMKQKMGDWANKYGVKEEFNNIVLERESNKTELAAKATMMVNKLPMAFQELLGYMLNGDQTIPEMINSTHACFQSMDPPTKRSIPHHFNGESPLGDLNRFRRHGNHHGILHHPMIAAVEESESGMVHTAVEKDENVEKKVKKTTTVKPTTKKAKKN